MRDSLQDSGAPIGESAECDRRFRSYSQGEGRQSRCTPQNARKGSESGADSGRYLAMDRGAVLGAYLAAISASAFLTAVAVQALPRGVVIV
jgi:hypothetical protein